VADDPQLDLAFGRGADGRTRLTRRRVRYPWALTRPFWLAEDPAGMATVIPQSSTGVLLAGDRVGQRLAVAAGAAAHVTSQGAQAVHAGSGEAALTWSLVAEAGAVLEVVTDPLVLFPGARVNQRVEVAVADDARLLLAEGIAWRPRTADPPFASFETRLTARRPDGRLLCREVARCRGEDADGLGGAGLAAVGQVWIFSSPHRALADALARLVEDAEGACCGWSALPNAAGYILRIAAPTAGNLPRLQRAAWVGLRTALYGGPPPDRRRGP